MRNERTTAQLRVTDFDRAVLAAAHMGLLTTRQVATKRVGRLTIHINGYFMGDVRVDASIGRLEKAGELTRLAGMSNTKLIFPDTPDWDRAMKLRERMKPILE